MGLAQYSAWLLSQLKGIDRLNQLYQLAIKPHSTRPNWGSLAIVIAA
jgi:hypothetical protein